MISTILIIAGAISAVSGFVLLFKILSYSEKAMLSSLSGNSSSEENEDTKRIRERNKKQLLMKSISRSVIGIIIIVSGWYLGYAARGEGFWFHKLLFNSEKSIVVSDDISNEEPFIAANGKEASYYLRVKGNEYEFCGVPCESIEEVEKLLSQIDPGQTIILKDCFAVASEYKAAEKLLNDKEFNYETEEE